MICDFVTGVKRRVRGQNVQTILGIRNTSNNGETNNRVHVQFGENVDPNVSNSSLSTNIAESPFSKIKPGKRIYHVC